MIHSWHCIHYMCGILGLVNKELSQDKEKFHRALKKQYYRGPDSEKTVEVATNCLFGFNRLTIQDLDARSMQPFEYQGNWLVFNGEIYNWKELRKEMEASGETFYTEGDTEVLSRGMSLEGRNFLKKLNGIFAFCFFDAKSQTYLIARDLMGVKPLFFSETDGLLFASDIAALLEYIKPEIDEVTLARHTFLDWFSAHDNARTFLKNISGLERGSYRVYDQFGSFVETAQFAELDFTTRVSDLHEAEKEFAKLMQETMEIETRSDTNVGIFLSGGTDSTTIVTHATKYLLKQQKDVPIFTKFYKEKGEEDDYIWATRVMDELEDKFDYSFDRVAINMDPALTEEDIRQAVRARHAPVTDIRQVSMCKLYRHVQKERGLKVILNGQGSDELYYGYYPLDYWLCKYYRSGNFTASEIVKYFGDELNIVKHKAMNAEHVSRAREMASEYLEKALSKYQHIPEKEKQMTAFFVDSIMQALLLYEDKLGMYSSIEVRVPLINPLLSKYSTICDWRIHLKSTDSGRHLLRYTLQGIFSEDIILRSKSPTPKRKKYADELLKILRPHKEAIENSKLLLSVYKTELLSNLEKLGESTGDYAYYGNVDDVLLEIAGLFFFEQEILI
jgi:asparagine synthase (glutamine-hydrolysing)